MLSGEILVTRSDDLFSKQMMFARVGAVLLLAFFLLLPVLLLLLLLLPFSMCNQINLRPMLERWGKEDESENEERTTEKFGIRRTTKKKFILFRTDRHEHRIERQY